MLEWQENYKNQVGEMVKQFTATLEAVQTAEQSLTVIAHQSQEFKKAADELKDILPVLFIQTDDLNKHLEAFAGLKDKAGEAFPIIEENLKKLTKTFAISVEEAVHRNDSMAKALKRNTDEMLEQNRRSMDHQVLQLENNQKAFNSEFTKTLQNVNTNSKDIMNDFSNTVKSISQDNKSMLDKQKQDFSSMIEQNQKSIMDQREQLSKNGEHIRISTENILKGIEGITRNMIDETNQNLKKQITTVDESMGEALSKSIESLGQMLARLSGKFVDDYTPLTDKLREIVRIAEDGRYGR